MLEECSLIDMNLQGYPYTWERGVGTSDRIEVRLDRALVTAGFMNMFKDATLTNLEILTSDQWSPVVGAFQGTSCNPRKAISL